MGLEELKKAIMKETEQAIKAIEKETEAATQQIMNEAKKEVQKYKQQKNEVLKQQKEDLKRKVQAGHVLEGKKRLHETKQRILDEVFHELEEKLRNLDKKERKRIIEQLLTKAEEEIAVAKVFVHPDDVSFIKKYAVEQAPLLGGLIAENEDGTIRVDYSFDTLLDQLKQKTLTEIASILFEKK